MLTLVKAESLSCNANFCFDKELIKFSKGVINKVLKCLLKCSMKNLSNC